MSRSKQARAQAQAQAPAHAQVRRQGLGFRSLLVAAVAPLGLLLSVPARGQSPPPPPAAPATAGTTAATGSAPAPRATTVLLHPSTPPSSVTLGRTLPDPPALVSKAQWVYDLRYSGGDLYLLGIRPVELSAPQATPRAMGRFALELYEGATLLERARFDFPMLGDGASVPSPPASSDAKAPLPIQGRPIALKISSRVGVMFPAWSRGTRVEIVDRATDRRWPLTWPPTAVDLSAPAISAPGTAANLLPAQRPPPAAGGP